MVILGLVLHLFILAVTVNGEGAQTAQESINVLHRIFHPIHAPDGPFVLRGSIRLDSASTPSIPQFSSAPEQLENVFGSQDIREDPTWLYQVALERPKELDVSSIKACHLTPNTAERLILHVSPRTNTPHAFDYFVSPVPSDGSCPTNPVAGRSITNTTVEVKSATSPPPPILKEPPKLTAEGQVVQPVPEKTFLQKYWMYIAGAMFALALTGGDEPPRK